LREEQCTGKEFLVNRQLLACPIPNCGRNPSPFSN
jgi:hypothetical protein